MAPALEERRPVANGSTWWAHVHRILSRYVVPAYPISLLSLLHFFSKAHHLVVSPSDQSSNTPTVTQEAKNPALLGDKSRADFQFWENTVRTALKTLMGGAGYETAALQQNLNFVSHSIAPFLGTRPVQGQIPRWKSFMTDDYSPLEYSWSWDEEPPIVRYSFEPIGPLAGTSQDPFNHEAPMAYVDHLRTRLPAADWRWFTHFADAFYNPLMQATVSKTPLAALLIHSVCIK